MLAIIDVDDPTVAPATTGVVTASGALYNLKLTRLFSQEELQRMARTERPPLPESCHARRRVAACSGGDGAGSIAARSPCCVRKPLHWRDETDEAIKAFEHALELNCNSARYFYGHVLSIASRDAAHGVAVLIQASPSAKPGAIAA